MRSKQNYQVTPPAREGGGERERVRETKKESADIFIFFMQIHARPLRSIGEGSKPVHFGHSDHAEDSVFPVP